MPKESTMVVKPISHGPGKLCNFGATVTGIDLNNLVDEDVTRLKEATHKYKVIVIKNQHNLEPIKHWELVTRLDPTAKQVHGHGTVKDFKKTGGFLSVRTPFRHISFKKLGY
jgi:xanthine dioxygenase